MKPSLSQSSFLADHGSRLEWPRATDILLWFRKGGLRTWGLGIGGGDPRVRKTSPWNKVGVWGLRSTVHGSEGKHLPRTRLGFKIKGLRFTVQKGNISSEQGWGLGFWVQEISGKPSLKLSSCPTDHELS